MIQSVMTQMCFYLGLSHSADILKKGSLTCSSLEHNQELVILQECSFLCAEHNSKYDATFYFMVGHVSYNNYDLLS